MEGGQKAEQEGGGVDMADPEKGLPPPEQEGGEAEGVDVAGPQKPGGAVVGRYLSPLSITLWGRKSSFRLATADPLSEDVSAWLSWSDLTVKVLNWKGESKTVLRGLTGVAEPGQLLAIMGPSGSGKSTLLDALSGRLATNTLESGTVLLNGHKKNLSYGIAAYVTQEDNLTGTLTVKESIWYSAQLRLPAGMALAEKAAIVDAAIVEMGLQECAETAVGNWHMRGISGGERRRLSIAIEILLRPRLLFLDEPTSGLDSASAFFVTQTLSNLARDGRTIIASIHQPSSEVFELFDTLYLLSNGKTIYFGQAAEACSFFAAAGFPCPAMRNPSDHYLRCINADFDRVKASLKSTYTTLGNPVHADPLEHIKTTHIISKLLESYSSSQYAMDAVSKVQEVIKRKGTVLDSCGSQAGFLKQAATLTQRSFTNMSRDAGYYWLRLVIYILVSLCVGTIYYNVGTSYTAILARGSCGAFIFGFVTFMSIGGFPSFVEDMKVFHRERLNGHYGVLSFVVGNTLSSVPFLFGISLVSATICYFMVRLHPGFEHYAFFTLGLFFSVMVVEGLMMAIASVVPNFLMGIITGAGIQGIFMLVAGYFRLPNDIPAPVWKYPVAFMSFDFWALQGQYQNDLRGMVFEDQQGVPSITGEYLLTEVFQIDLRRSKWWDLSVILAMVFIYRIIFFIVIKLNEDFTPWLRGYVVKRALSRRALRHAQAAYRDIQAPAPDPAHVSTSSSPASPSLYHPAPMSPIRDSIPARP